MVAFDRFTAERSSHICLLQCIRSKIFIPVVPHEAVGEVSKIGNVKERLVVVNHG